MKYPLAASTFTADERDAIAEVVASDRFTMGPKVAAFEQNFADYFNSRYAVMVNSGSSANLIAIAALRYRKQGRALKPGDEVIVPCISWSTTYYPLLQYGLKPVFVDIDPDTLNLDLAKVEDAITPKTAMILAVSILGNPCDFAGLQTICEVHDLILLEDNCESMGATLNGKFTGTFGVMGTFSTFFSHHISTMEGGMIITDDHELYCLMKSLRNHGWTRDQPQDSTIYDNKADDFYEAYRFILPGYNLRPTEISGALGLVQMKKLDDFLAVRRKNAATFQSLFGQDARFRIQQEHGSSSWFAFTMVLNPEAKLDRDKVLSALRTAGIEHRIVTGGNFLRHDVIDHFPEKRIHSRTHADHVHDHGFFVGNHIYDLQEQLNLLAEALAAV
jgi:CDP-6-deoxy-D-xylo-4-hexulose-3-dehydrase